MLRRYVLRVDTEPKIVVAGPFDRIAAAKEKAESVDGRARVVHHAQVMQAEEQGVNQRISPEVDL